MFQRTFSRAGFDPASTSVVNPNALTFSAGQGIPVRLIRTAAWRILFAVLLFVGTANAWDIGFDFRDSSGFVTDPASTTWVLGSTAYPTTRTVNGVTIVFGWESTSAVLARDRSSSTDARLAGINCGLNNGTAAVFRVDLPAKGSYAIASAVGDQSFQQFNHVNLLDTGFILLALNGTTQAGSFMDSTGQFRTSGSWSATNSVVQRSFGSQQLRVQLGGQTDSAGGYSCLAHLRVTSVAVQTSLSGPSRSFMLQ